MSFSNENLVLQFENERGAVVVGHIGPFIGSSDPENDRNETQNDFQARDYFYEEDYRVSMIRINHSNFNNDNFNSNNFNSNNFNNNQ